MSINKIQLNQIDGLVSIDNDLNTLKAIIAGLNSKVSTLEYIYHQPVDITTLADNVEVFELDYQPSKRNPVYIIINGVWYKENEAFIVNAENKSLTWTNSEKLPINNTICDSITIVYMTNYKDITFVENNESSTLYPFVENEHTINLGEEEPVSVDIFVNGSKIDAETKPTSVNISKLDTNNNTTIDYDDDFRLSI